jgi:hypothetical protein
MSTKLTKALEFANYRVTMNNQQAMLKAKTESLLTYSVNGGSFIIDRGLITFCKTLIDSGTTDAVLLDVYDNPILIDVTDFYAEILSRYFEVTNDYYTEFEKIRKARKTHKILELNEDGEKEKTTK